MTTSRREFLSRGLTAAAALPLLGPRLRALPVPLGSDERVLVLLELNGGNDGLGTVIPFEDDLYHQARPTLRQPKNAVLRLSDEIGLHPALTGLERLFGDGRLAVVQGVGYPRPDRSHFRSMDIWHTASLTPEDTPHGWIGRLADGMRERDPARTPAMVLGARDIPLALSGERAAVPSVRDARQFRVHSGSGPDAPRREEFMQEIARAGGNSGMGESASKGSLEFLRQSSQAAFASVESVSRAVDLYKDEVEYPSGPVGENLRLAAQLIDGRLPTSVFYLRQGGYDTHAAQADTHRLLLADLGNGLAAFFDDLSRLGAERRVTVLVYSEFGRRVKENGSRGTDHGAAAPCFIASGSMRGGLVGDQPALDDLDDGDLRFSIDYRRVYATLLRDWLKVPSGPILQASFEPLPLFRRWI